MIAWRGAAVLLLTASAARAQPAASEPVPKPADPEAPLVEPEPATDSADYPRGLVDRPLALPGGMLEGTLAATLHRTARGPETVWSTNLGPSIRYAVGPFELEGGANFLVHASPDTFARYDRLSAVFVAASYAPNPEMTVGAQLAFGDDELGSDLRTMTPRLVLGRKQLLTETVAIEGAFAAGVSRFPVVQLLNTPGDSDDVETAFIATGEARVQVQAAPLLAVQARAALNVRHEDTVGTNLSHEYGLGVLASIAHTIDLMPSANLFVYDGAIGLVFSLELSVRNR